VSGRAHLILYPSWGYGRFGLRSNEASRMVRIMLLGHSAFGVGIGLRTALLLKPAAEESLGVAPVGTPTE
jgi:hypothetical protein